MEICHWENDPLTSGIVQQLQSGIKLETREYLRPIFRWNKIGGKFYDVAKSFEFAEWMVTLSKFGDFRLSIQPQQNLVPKYAYNTIITMCQRNNAIDHAERAYEIMNFHRFEPDVFTLTALIDVIGRHREIEKSVSIFESMLSSNHTLPNIVTFITLFRLIGKDNDSARASVLLSQVFQDLLSAYEGKKLPSLIGDDKKLEISLYNAALATCVRLCDLSNAQIILKQMIRDNNNGNNIASGRCSSTCCRRNGFTYFLSLNATTKKIISKLCRIASGKPSIDALDWLCDILDYSRNTSTDIPGDFGACMCTCSSNSTEIVREQLRGAIFESMSIFQDQDELCNGVKLNINGNLGRSKGRKYPGCLGPEASETLRSAVVIHDINKLLERCLNASSEKPDHEGEDDEDENEDQDVYNCSYSSTSLDCDYMKEIGQEDEGEVEGDPETLGESVDTGGGQGDEGRRGDGLSTAERGQEEHGIQIHNGRIGDPTGYESGGGGRGSESATDTVEGNGDGLRLGQPLSASVSVSVSVPDVYGSVVESDFVTLIHQCRKRKWSNQIELVVNAMVQLATVGHPATTVPAQNSWLPSPEPFLASYQTPSLPPLPGSLGLTERTPPPSACPHPAYLTTRPSSPPTPTVSPPSARTPSLPPEVHSLGDSPPCNHVDRDLNNIARESNDAPPRPYISSSTCGLPPLFHVFPTQVTYEAAFDAYFNMSQGDFAWSLFQNMVQNNDYYRFKTNGKLAINFQDLDFIAFLFKGFLFCNQVAYIERIYNYLRIRMELKLDRRIIKGLMCGLGGHPDFALRVLYDSLLDRVEDKPDNGREGVAVGSQRGSAAKQSRSQNRQSSCPFTEETYMMFINTLLESCACLGYPEHIPVIINQVKHRSNFAISMAVDSAVTRPDGNSPMNMDEHLFRTEATFHPISTESIRRSSTSNVTGQDRDPVPYNMTGDRLELKADSRNDNRNNIGPAASTSPARALERLISECNYNFACALLMSACTYDDYDRAVEQLVYYYRENLLRPYMFYMSIIDEAFSTGNLLSQRSDSLPTEPSRYSQSCDAGHETESVNPLGNERCDLREDGKVGMEAPMEDRNARWNGHRSNCISCVLHEQEIKEEQEHYGMQVKVRDDSDVGPSARGGGGHKIRTTKVKKSKRSNHVAGKRDEVGDVGKDGVIVTSAIGREDSSRDGGAMDVRTCQADMSQAMKSLPFSGFYRVGAVKYVDYRRPLLKKISRAITKSTVPLYCAGPSLHTTAFCDTRPSDYVADVEGKGMYGTDMDENEEEEESAISFMAESDGDRLGEVDPGLGTVYVDHRRNAVGEEEKVDVDAQYVKLLYFKKTAMKKDWLLRLPRHQLGMEEEERHSSGSVSKCQDGLLHHYITSIGSIFYRFGGPGPVLGNENAACRGRIVTCVQLATVLLLQHLHTRLLVIRDKEAKEQLSKDVRDAVRTYCNYGTSPDQDTRGSEISGPYQIVTGADDDGPANHAIRWGAVCDSATSTAGDAVFQPSKLYYDARSRVLSLVCECIPASRILQLGSRHQAKLLTLLLDSIDAVLNSCEERSNGGWYTRHGFSPALSTSKSPTRKKNNQIEGMSIFVAGEHISFEGYGPETYVDYFSNTVCRTSTSSLSCLDVLRDLQRHLNIFYQTSLCYETVSDYVVSMLERKLERPVKVMQFIIQYSLCYADVIDPYDKSSRGDLGVANNKFKEQPCYHDNPTETFLSNLANRRDRLNERLLTALFQSVIENEQNWDALMFYFKFNRVSSTSNVVGANVVKKGEVIRVAKMFSSHQKSDMAEKLLLRFNIDPGSDLVAKAMFVENLTDRFRPLGISGDSSKLAINNSKYFTLKLQSGNIVVVNDEETVMLAESILLDKLDGCAYRPVVGVASCSDRIDNGNEAITNTENRSDGETLAYESEGSVVGIDVEWRPASIGYGHDDEQVEPNKCCLLQIAVTTHVFLFDLMALEEAWCGARSCDSRDSRLVSVGQVGIEDVTANSIEEVLNECNADHNGYNPEAGREVLVEMLGPAADGTRTLHFRERYRRLISLLFRSPRILKLGGLAPPVRENPLYFLRKAQCTFDLFTIKFGFKMTLLRISTLVDL